MKTTNLLNQTIFLFLLIGLLAACKKDDDGASTPPDNSNEGELITTLSLTFVDTGGTHPNVTATFRDSDGGGGNTPTQFDTIRLADSTTYSVTILLLNESRTPADTISNEVLDEGDEHLFCFSPSGINLTVVNSDSDGTFGIGLQSTWTTTNASNGTVQIELKHQPGIKDGTCAPGETDVQVNFVTEIL